MSNQFTRFAQLIGQDSLEKLSQKRVLIFGLGGVGGHICDALARSGIKHFTLVDKDIVDITNINRQLIADLSTVGKDKVDVMEQHLHLINPDITVDKRKVFYLPEIADEFDFNNFDYVIDAIDTVTSKIDIIYRCSQCEVPVISALGCGNKMEPTQLEVADLSKTSYDPLAKVLRRELKKKGIEHIKVVFSKEKPVKVEEQTRVPSSSAFVPSVAGLIIASEVVKDLLKKE